jgi:LEA14-like dessication related protein
MSSSIRFRRALLVAASALSLAFASGCVSKPVIALHHADLKEVSLQGLDLKVVIQIHNPNAYDVEVRAVHAQVTIAGKYKLEPMDLQPNKWLPAGETTLIAVPVYIPWPMVPGLIAETLGTPDVKYRVQGSADVTATRTFGIEKNNYPLDEEASLPRQVFVDLSSGTVHF